MSIPLSALIFQGIPEQLAVVTLTFVLANVRIKRINVVITGAILAIIAYVIRLLPVTFGIHTIINLGLLFIILVQVFKTPVFIALISAMTTLLVLILLETSILYSLFMLFGINLTVFQENDLIRILVTLPQVVIIFLIAWIIFKYKSLRKDNEFITIK